jgi:hypothetical protein
MAEYDTLPCLECGHDHPATFRGGQLTRVSDCDECECPAESFVLDDRT